MKALSRWLTACGRRRIPYLTLALPFLLLVAPPSRGDATEPTVWCHKVSWTSINNLAHTARRDFPLGIGQATWPGQPVRTGAREDVDAATDCSLASQAGINAFDIDMIVNGNAGVNQQCLDRYLNAAATVHAETGQPFYVCPCLDTPGQLTPAALAAQIQSLTAGRTSRPEWPKFQGTPILWTYAGTSPGAAYWKQTFALLAAQNVSVIVVLDGCSLFSAASTALPTADLDTYATLPVALYAFRTDFDQTGMIKCRQYLAAYHASSVAAQLTIGTVWPGYWSQTNGWYVDPQGTKRIRDTFAAAQASRWVAVTSWDDYAETTEFQPSVGLGTGRLDLLHALLAARAGATWPAATRFYLWQSNELHVGDSLNGEALALVAAGPATVQVNLCDKYGSVLVAGTPVTFTTPGVHALPFSFPVTGLPAGRVAYVSLVAQAADFPQQSFLSEPTYVWPSGDSPWRTLRGTMWQAGKQAGIGPQVTVAQQSSLATAMTAAWSAPAGQMLLRQNFNLVDFPNANVGQENYALNSTTSRGPLPCDVFTPMPTAQRWGFCDAVGVTPDGTVNWSEPTWVEPPGGYSWVTSLWHLNEGTGVLAADSTPYVGTATLKGSAAWNYSASAGRSSLALDGQSGYVQLPSAVLPKSDFTLSMQVMPSLDPGATTYTRDQYLFCDQNAVLVLRLTAAGRLLAMRMRSDGKWATVTGTTTLTPGQWAKVTVTYDQQTLSVYLNGHPEGAYACQGMRLSTLTTLGCNPLSAAGGFFRGLVQEVGVQSKAFTPAAQ